MKLCFWISDFAEASRRSSVALEKDRVLQVETVFKKSPVLRGALWPQMMELMEMNSTVKM